MKVKRIGGVRGVAFALAFVVASMISGCGGGGINGNSAHAWVLDTANHIRRIRLDTGVIETSAITVTGLQGGESLLAIDVRAATTELYGLGNTGRLYKINVTTGAATLVGSGIALTGTAFGFDVNTVVDRIRVVSDADQNQRLNPDTAAPIVDTTLAYDPGDTHSGADPSVVAIAYSNNFVSATQTTLFGLDSTQNTLVRIGGANGTPSPNGGLVNTIAPVGLDFTSESGMDIDNQDTFAYAVLSISGNTESTLATIDLGTGQATVISPIAIGALTRDIAIIP